MRVTGAEDVLAARRRSAGSGGPPVRHAGVGAELAASVALVLWSVPQLPGSAAWQALLLASGLAVAARASAVPPARGSGETARRWCSCAAVALVAVAGLVPGRAAAGRVRPGLRAPRRGHGVVGAPAASALLVAAAPPASSAAVVLAGSGLDAWLLQVAATALVAVLLASLRSHRALLRELVDHELTDPVTGLPGRALPAPGARGRGRHGRASRSRWPSWSSGSRTWPRSTGRTVPRSGTTCWRGSRRACVPVLPDGALLARAGDDRLAVVAPATDAALAWELAAGLRAAATAPARACRTSWRGSAWSSSPVAISGTPPPCWTSPPGSPPQPEPERCVRRTGSSPRVVARPTLRARDAGVEGWTAS